MAVIEFPAKRDVLARHVVIRCRHIPGLEWITGILREIGSARSRSRTVDRGQENQIPAGIVDLASAQRESVSIFVEPPTVVEHVSEKTLFIGDDLACGILLVGRAIHTAPALA